MSQGTNELEKVATSIANSCVKSTLILIGSALETALKTVAKNEKGEIVQLTEREILIVLTNTIGEYVKNIEQSENKGRKKICKPNN